MMMWRVHLSLLVVLVQVLVIAAMTDADDLAALKALKDIWDNVPPNWDGVDPCGEVWDGISCNDDDRVVSVKLSSINLIGQLSSDITALSELKILDLSYNKGLTGSLPATIGDAKKLTNLVLVGCAFSGEIPPSIGSLQQLKYLSLNSNNFIGEIPSSLGNLQNLYWLDLADNKLTGTIPVSDGSSPGLDMLIHSKHFHLGKNRLSGVIPPQLFNSNMALIHLLLEHNQLTGEIPFTLGLVQNLEVVRLDRNSLSGSVPDNLNNLTSVKELFLANNELTGPLPDLTGMNSLNYVDMSNNSFDATDIPPWFLSLQSLTSLIMDDTQIQGELPVSLFSLIMLQTVKMRNNRINGTLDIGSKHSTQLKLIDLRDNNVEAFTQRPGSDTINIILEGNPICNEDATQSYCIIPQQSNSLYSTPAENCSRIPCTPNRISSPNCKCAYPYTGTLIFRAPSFSTDENSTIFESLNQKLMDTFKPNSLPVDSVSLSNPTRNVDDYLELNLQVFPSGSYYFNHSGISGIGFMLSNQTFKPPPLFGPFVFNGNSYAFFADSKTGPQKSPSTNLLIGVAVCGVLLLLLLFAGVYAFRLKRRAETAGRKNDPFALWDSKTNSGGVPQVDGTRSFSFEELRRSTNNFSETNSVGSGGYGKVYRGTLSNGQLVAIKRAQEGSMQGGLEFKTEIELLSRVHHKNVVGLIGFCFDQGEQMLVYEYMENGTLKDTLSARTGIRLDWMRRLRIALGAAKGLQYLHELANPPIIHRDIKSSNILLDKRLNAKIADFGLSKIVDDPEKGHVTTQVKGSMGYMDPEYYTTQELTEKSDVYSFGVLLLELLTARNPIEKRKYIVRQVKEAMDRTKKLYNLENILDPIVASSMYPTSLEKFVDLALRCVEELRRNRPGMSEVVKEIENIMEFAGLNPNAESASTSASYEGQSKSSNLHPYSSESLVEHSADYPSSSLESK